MSLSEFNYSFHWSHRGSLSLGSGWSQSLVSLQKSCMISRPWITIGAMNPKGSNILFTIDKTPRLVKALSWKLELKVKQLLFKSQALPRLCYIGNSSIPMFIEFRFLSRSSSGNCVMTYILLDAILCNRIFPWSYNTNWVFFNRFTAS